MRMGDIEQGKNTSFQWGKDNMKVINRYGLEQNSPSSVINTAIERYDDVERLKKELKDWKNGHINTGQLIKEIENL